MAFKPGDKVYRLTVLKKVDFQRFKVRCECGHVFVAYASSLKKGYKQACEACQKLIKKLEREIAAAKLYAENNGIRTPLNLPEHGWEYEPKEQLPEV